MDHTYNRVYTYKSTIVGVQLRCRDLRCKPKTKEGLGEAVALLKNDISGKGFIRAQIGIDVLQLEIRSVEDVTSALLERLTEPLYGLTGTHGYDEILSLAVYVVNNETI